MAIGEAEDALDTPGPGESKKAGRKDIGRQADAKWVVRLYKYTYCKYGL